MAITNLTGTKWRFNSRLNYSSVIGVRDDLNFISNGTEFNFFGIGTTTDVVLRYGDYIPEVPVEINAYNFDLGQWTNDAYRTITITGGASATDLDFIGWLEMNADQIIETVVEYKTTNTELTAIADAIRAKGGTSASLVYPAGFVSAIEAISSGDDLTDFIENGNAWTSYKNLSATKIRAYAFCDCSNLTSVSFPACTNIGSVAFAYCYSLKSAIFPICTNIGNSAFSQCTSLTSVSFPVCNSIGDDAFCNCHSLSSVSFPVCTRIGYAAFAYCSNITSVSFPTCSSIGNYAFQNCTSLTSASFSECSRIGSAAFYECSNLKSAIFPICTNIGNSAFAYCYSLNTVSFPACTSISDSAFAYCYSLKTVSFPVCNSIGAYAFAYCSNITSVSFPECTNIGNSAFRYCSNLKSVRFPVCTSIRAYAFANCYNLISLYLTGASFVSLANSNAFSSTPIGGYSTSAGKYGSIYVKSSMLSSYKTRTNWTYFSSRMVGV